MMDPSFRIMSALKPLMVCVFAVLVTSLQAELTIKHSPDSFYLKDTRITIESVSVASQGLNRPALASVVVKTPVSVPAFIYWSDVTTWLPAEGHPNYTITQEVWKAEKHIMLKSTIEIKTMLLSQLSYYYDYDREHLIYYLPMSADIRSGDGSLIYHHTFDIPEKPATQNHTQLRFRVVLRPETAVNYTDGEKVTLQWRFLSRDENEFTMWRTLFESPTPENDLDYADQMLYAEDFTKMYPEEVLKFDHINITKAVYKVGKLFLVSFIATIDPAGLEDEALYVLFVKSRHLLSWDKAVNLRLSTRLLRQNVTSLMHDEVALALSYCDGNDVAVVNGTGYVGLNSSIENCVKCEAYGNEARDLIYTKNRYLVRPTSTNALVYSSYYPETRSAMYTFRRPAEEGDKKLAGSGEQGEYFCRAILKNNTVVSRKFHVAWTEPVVLEADIVTVNQTEAQVECRASGEPQPTLTAWRCDGDSFCNLKMVDGQPGFDVQLIAGDHMTLVVTVSMPAAKLKREAILCRASNKFDTKEDWLLFDDQIHIEEAEAVLDENETEEPLPPVEDDITGNYGDFDNENIDDIENEDDQQNENDFDEKADDIGKSEVEGKTGRQVEAAVRGYGEIQEDGFLHAGNEVSAARSNPSNAAAPKDVDSEDEGFIFSGDGE